jgi:hypothetical protein
MSRNPWQGSKAFWLILMTVVLPFGWAAPLVRGALAHAMAPRPGRF